MISKATKLVRLVSPEILQEIRDSFSQKYGVGMCIYDSDGELLIRFPDALPSLSHLDIDQKRLFHIFYNISDQFETAVTTTEPIMQQFGDGLIVRSFFSITLEKEILGVVCIVDIRRFITNEQDGIVLDELAKAAEQNISPDDLLDKNKTAVTGDFVLWTQELKDVLQLFVEAGKARSHIDDLITREQEHPAMAATKTGILFCSTTGMIIDAQPDAADLLGYAKPQDLCDFNLFDDLVVDEQNKKELQLMVLEQDSDPATAVLSKKDGIQLEVTLQLLPQQADGVTFGFECHLIAHQKPLLHDVQEYERDQTAIGLIEELSQEKDEFELPGHVDTSWSESGKKRQREYVNEHTARDPLLDHQEHFKPSITMLAHLLNASDTATLLIDSFNRIQLWNTAFMGLLDAEAKLLQKASITSLLVANIHSTWERWRERMLKAPNGAVLKPKVQLPLIKKDASVMLCNVQIRKIDFLGNVYLVLTLLQREKSAPSNDSDTLSERKKAIPSIDETRLEFADFAHIQQHYKNVRAQFSQMAEVLSESVSSNYLSSLQNEESKKRYTSIKRIADVSAYIERNLAYFTQEHEPNFVPTEINYLVGEIKDRLQQFLPINIELRAHLDASVKRIMADQDMLVHALGTICKNAIDAMPRGGSLIIETGMSTNGEHVIISVTDTGDGFKDSFKERLMMPFYSTKKNSLGKGLGLAAAFGIFKTHGGTLSAESNESQGTTILAQVPAIAEEVDASNEENKTDDAYKGFILIIDDEIDIAEATAMALTRENYFAITSGSCADGLAMFEMYRDEIDVIVIDNMLLDSRGIDCAQQISERDENAHFVFYSGGDDDFKLAAYIKETGSGWLQKPFKTKELIVQIENQLAGKNVE